MISFQNTVKPVIPTTFKQQPPVNNGQTEVPTLLLNVMYCIESLLDQPQLLNAHTHPKLYKITCLFFYIQQRLIQAS